MGGIGFCGGIINNPQRFVKVKVWGDGKGLIFVADSSLCSDDGSSEWIWPIAMSADFFSSRQVMLRNQKKTLILFKSTDCLDWWKNNYSFSDLKIAWCTLVQLVAS